MNVTEAKIQEAVAEERAACIRAICGMCAKGDLPVEKEGQWYHESKVVKQPVRCLASVLWHRTCL